MNNKSINKYMNNEQQINFVQPGGHSGQLEQGRQLMTELNISINERNAQSDKNLGIMHWDIGLISIIVDSMVEATFYKRMGQNERAIEVRFLN